VASGVGFERAAEFGGDPEIERLQSPLPSLAASAERAGGLPSPAPPLCALTMTCTGRFSSHAYRVIALLIITFLLGGYVFGPHFESIMRVTDNLTNSPIHIFSHISQNGFKHWDGHPIPSLSSAFLVPTPRSSFPYLKHR
jgi:hypothetical protein